jgi:hypothetical protein
MADYREMSEVEFCRSLAMMAAGSDSNFERGYTYLLVASAILLASGYAEADLGQKAIEAGDSILLYAERVRSANPALCDLLKVPVPGKGK